MKLKFYKQLKSYYDNNEECLIALDDDIIFTECRIINPKVEDNKIQFTCNSDFIDNSFGRCELIIDLNDVKYIGRQLKNIMEDEEYYNDDDNEDNEDWEETLA